MYRFYSSLENSHSLTNKKTVPFYEKVPKIQVQEVPLYEKIPKISPRIERGKPDMDIEKYINGDEEKNEKTREQTPEKSSFPYEKKANTDINGHPHDSTGKYTSLNPTSTRAKKKKVILTWDNTCQFLSINSPVPIYHPTIKKKYFISFIYKQNGKIHKKTIKFGKRGVDDYIDHADTSKRDKQISKMHVCENPFKGNFWKQRLLNKYKTLSEAYMEILKTYKLI